MKAKIVPAPPQVMAAEVAGEQLAGVGQAVVKAATTPIYSRKTRQRKNQETGEWEDVDREKELNVTPAALVAVAIVGGVAAAVAQRGLRTGTVTTKVQHEYVESVPVDPNARKRTVWIDDGASLPAHKDPRAVWTATNRSRNRPVVRTRESIADYPAPGKIV